MTTHRIDENAKLDEATEKKPAEVSLPVGSAIPTPVEPGLDQSLPEKEETKPAEGGPAQEPATERPAHKTATRK